MEILQTFEEDLLNIPWQFIDQYMQDVLAYTNQYFGMHYQLKSQMPAGYELAFGLADEDTHTIYVNRSEQMHVSDHELTFHFLHELRHAVQYANPSLFSDIVLQSLKYVFQYDGKVFYKVNGNWHTYQIAGDQDYLLELYLASPCEVDANTFALRIVERILPDVSFACIKKSRIPAYQYFAREDTEAHYRNIIDEIEKEGA